MKIQSIFLVWDNFRHKSIRSWIFKEKHQTVLSFVNNYHRSIWISLFHVSFTANRFSFNILPSYFDLRVSIAWFLSSINQMTQFLSCVALSKPTHIIYVYISDHLHDSHTSVTTSWVYLEVYVETHIHICFTESLKFQLDSHRINLYESNWNLSLLKLLIFSLLKH